MGKYAIGIDFGTASGRVVAVDVKTGKVAGTHSTPYRHGVITEKLPGSETVLKRNSALQHPQDYLDVLVMSIPACLQEAAIHPEDVIGIGIDFTSCTILPVNENFEPLSFDARLANEPNAWVKLWKHHAAQNQANRINQLAKERNEAWLKRYGGIISPEWILPKVLEILEDSPEVYENAAYFMEASDWITAIMTGVLKRNSCAAGFKGIWNKESGYINKGFLKALHPKLENIYENKLSGDVVSIGQKAGNLTADFAKKIGLKEGLPVAMGIIDAHAGVLGSGVTSPDQMVLVIGTSTCHMVLSENEKFVDGISGVVENGIIPDLFAYEAGQAAVGDIFDWYTKENVPSYIEKNAQEAGKSVHEYLEGLAQKLDPGSNGLLALDWHNGCRTPLVDAGLSGVFVGLTLTTKPEEMYRALIESTAFGTKLIIDQFAHEGILVNELVACGGIPHKNKMMMQIYADVTGMPIKIASNTLTPAIGSAMYGAVAAGSTNGGYDTIKEAAKKMASLEDFQYEPNPINTKKYAVLYMEYKKLVNYFGKRKNNLMKQLNQL